MKTKIYTIAIICAAMSLINGCADEKNISPSPLTVEEAQAWFTEFSSTKVRDISQANGRISDARSTAKIKKQLFWEKGMVRKVLGRDILILPIWYENNYRFGKQTTRQLWIYKNDAKKFEAKIVELLATQEYKKSHLNIRFKDFTGSLTIHDWHNGFEIGYQLEEGQKVGKIRNYTFGSNKKNLNNGRTEACGYYQYTYVSVPSLGYYYAPQIQWIPTACAYEYYWYPEPYDYYSWVSDNYGCEAFNNCTTPDSGYQEPEPEPEPEIDLYDYIVEAPNNDKKIDDIKIHLKCFDITKPAKLTIYADQPVPGTRRAYAFPRNVGHSFISIEQTINGITTIRTYGFYPNESATPFDKEDKSALFDDSGHSFDVSVSVEITATELSKIVDYTINKTPAIYHLDDYNCTNFAVSACDNAQIDLPQNSGNWVVGSGLNPGGFGEDLRNLDLPNKVETKDLDGGLAPQNSGKCN